MSIEHKWKCITDKDGTHLYDELRSHDSTNGKVIITRVSSQENYFCTQMTVEANERALIRARE